MYKVGRVLKHALIYFILLVVFVLVLYPVIWMFINSLKPTWEILTNPFSLPTTFNLENYITAWNIANFGRVFLNTVGLLAISLSGILIISCMGGYVFGKLQFPGKNFLFYFWLAGMMVPPHVSLIPNFVIIDYLGLIDNYLSLILVYFGSATFGVFVMRSFFMSVPTEILEAALIDGCSESGVFWRIAVPLAKGGLTTIAIFYFVFLWNDYMYPMTFLRSDSKNTISIALTAFRDVYITNWGSLLAALSLASLPPIIFYFIFQRQFIRGLTAGALKG